MTTDVAYRMDRIYRPQRWIYDLTRRPYLIGRDPLLQGIGAKPGEAIVEIGCGTGRNLVKLARLYPRSRLIGVEPSTAMLETAAAAVHRHNVDVHLVSGTAEGLSAADLGQPGGVDHVVFSYVLSMVDDPARAVDDALALLRSGGRLHVVDFADMAGLPRMAAGALRQWLRWFEVVPRPNAADRLDELAAAGDGRLDRIRLLGGYAELLRFRLG
jgi:S-adenosylmethionine-diacylgycerolhomoserine-N-methlytransferase